MSAGVVDHSRGEQPDGRATRWDDHRTARKRRVLESAIDAISESGSDIAVAEIAERAGVPRSVVYRIFADRSDLDEQVRTLIVERLMADVAPALTPRGTVGESITTAVQTYIKWIVAYPRLHQFLGSGSATRRDTGSKVVTGTKTAIGLSIAQLFDGVLTEHKLSPEASESLAFALLGLVDAPVNRWIVNTGPKLSPDELAQFLDRSIWQVLEGVLHDTGADIGRDTPISEMM